MSKIPVTVITGFLGAGKTSLLNQLIKNHKEKKFVIIENEFGEENIDSELVANIGNEDLFELSNGCICCNLNTELFLVLENLIKNNHSFNHLLIETTARSKSRGSLPSSILRFKGLFSMFKIYQNFLKSVSATHSLFQIVHPIALSSFPFYLQMGSGRGRGD